MSRQRTQMVHTSDILSPQSSFWGERLECLLDLVHVRVSCFRCGPGQRKSCDGVEEGFGKPFFFNI